MARVQINLSWWSSQSVLVILCLVFFSLQTASGIVCYVCDKASDNSQCNQDQHLVNCTKPGDDRAFAPRFDTCSTKVEYIGNTKQISKQCVKGPCSLGKSQDKALGLSNDCGPKKSNRMCKYCCTTDRCNANQASGPRPKSFVVYYATWSMLVLIAGICRG